MIPIIKHNSLKQFALNWWIKNIRLELGKELGYISDFHIELDFMKQKFGTEIISWGRMQKEQNVKYKADLLFGRIQWDWQYSADKTIQTGGADCNSINRIYQMFLTINSIETFLVTYWVNKPNFNLSHTTVIGKENGKYFDFDYGIRTNNCVSEKWIDVVLEIASRYKVEEISAITVQDIFWNIIKMETL
jgi:hypothetical protein